MDGGIQARKVSELRYTVLEHKGELDKREFYIE